MRIAIYHNLPSGGGKRALFEMVKHMAGSHELEIFTTASAEHDFCDLRPYVSRYRVYPFTPTTLLRSPFGRSNAAIRIFDLFRLDTLQSRIAKEIDTEKFDLVFVHNCRFSQAPGLIRYLNTKTVYYCGEPPRSLTEPQINRPYFHRSNVQRISDLIDPLPGLYKRTLLRQDRTSVLAATKILVNSAYSRETFYRQYGRFSTIGYLGVDTNMFHPLGDERQPYVCSVGEIRPNKGFDFLVKSLALIPDDRRPMLVIACNSANFSEKMFLKNLANQLRVQLLIKEMISDEELVKLYNQALFTLYAPVMEPFGFVPLESMACGTSVIGVNEAGVRETIVNRVTGLLVDRETALFADTILHLLSNPGLVSKYGRDGRDNVIQNWTWNKSIEKIEKHLITA